MDDAATPSGGYASLRRKVLKATLDATRVKADELTPLLWSGCCIFCLMMAYYIIRPVRDAMGVEGGVKNLPWLFTATLIAMVFVNIPFSAASRKLPRMKFITLSYRFFLANLIIFAALFQFASPEQAVWIGRAFFVWVSVFNLFVVSVFWAFIVDVFDAERGKRMFALVSAGATAGAICGSALTAGLAKWIPTTLLLVLSGLLLEFALICVRKLSQSTNTLSFCATPQNRRSNVDDPKNAARPLGGSVLAGIAHTLRSPYLAVICLNMLFFSVTSTVLYFQVASAAHTAFATASGRTSFFATLDFTVNVFTLITQVFFTNRLINRFGVARVLTCIPMLSAIGFGALAFVPSLIFLFGFSAFRRAGNFALARPTREILFTVISREDKYKAKNFIDTVVYRTGDQIGSWSWGALNSFGVSEITISLLVAVPLSLFWAISSYWLGMRQKEMAAIK